MSGQPTWWQVFGVDYAHARQRFRAAADRAGATLTSYVHPSAKAPDGGELSVDVARLGAAHAPHQLLAISGTHGLEGGAGSAVQTAWLAHAAGTLPPDVAVTFVHAINPYGFAHTTRTTENNVDLNRNFIDHDRPHPVNPHYASLHDHLIPAEWTTEGLAQSSLAIDAFRAEHGPDALFNTLASGQYTHADGLIYGGRAREWSNLTLQTIVERELSQAQRIGLIDWHTGIGEYGAPFFLCFNAEGSDEQREAVRWWGAQRVLDQRPHGLQRPDYQGLVFRGVEQFAKGRPVIGAVVEFGTRGANASLANRLDQWLRSRARVHPDAVRDAQLRADVLDAFVPVSSVWRNSVLTHGLQITAQALQGLATRA
ncbi:deacylase [Pandoraea faecigallinarum]|uniref:Deacylase n=1 Tax=Pandoraea faecigallinarum TaxID=656179 RepID=A0A0H3WTM6_9BURK|nr:M14 family metallopeptidase [Pandoraea faecigallinarum]AKM31097.1 deacylase [Pandoraea faecigallinarum]